MESVGVWTPGLPELIIILVALLLLFGAKKLPEIARSVGKSTNEFKRGLKEGTTEPDEPEKPETTNGQRAKGETTATE